jgi:hypothetical protein
MTFSHYSPVSTAVLADIKEKSGFNLQRPVDAARLVPES